jgi:hypothetical protein
VSHPPHSPIRDGPDNKTPKVETKLFARVNRFDQPIKTWDKMFLKIFEQKCKVEEQISNSIKLNQLTKAKYNSQFLLLPSTLRIKKPKIFKEISVSEFK